MLGLLVKEGKQYFEKSFSLFSKSVNPSVLGLRLLRGKTIFLKNFLSLKSVNSSMRRVRIAC